MLEKLFDDRPEFLKPGMKSKMIFELCKMCFFEYEIYEQWTNEGVDADLITPENPPKVTRYRHNTKWHIDKDEDESDGDTTDEEDMEARGGKVGLKALAKKNGSRPNSRGGGSRPTSSGGGRRFSSEESAKKFEEEKKSGEEDAVAEGSPQVFSTKKTRKKTITTMKKSPHVKSNRDMRSQSPGSRGGSPERAESPPPIAGSSKQKQLGSPDKPEVSPKGKDKKMRRRSTAVKEFSTEPGSRTSVWQKKKVWTVEYLKISKGRKMSAADVRRDELRIKRAEEARAAEEARRAWLAMPRRMRGLLVGCTARINGHMLTAMCYEFRQQVRVGEERITRVSAMSEATKRYEYFRKIFPLTS